MARVLRVDKNVEEIMGFPQVFWRKSFAQFRCPLVENSVDNVQKLDFLINWELFGVHGVSADVLQSTL